MDKRMIKYRYCLVVLLLLMSRYAMAQQFVIEGGDDRNYAYWEDYRSTTGINAVYVVYGTADKKIKFSSRSKEPMTWYTYEDVLTPLPSIQNNYTSTIELTNTECGYVVQQDGKAYYIYVIDYIKHPLVLNDVSVQDGNAMCDIVTLQLDGSGNEMCYYAFNNMMPYSVDRNIKITFNTLVWDEAAVQYVENPCEVVLDQFSPTYPVTAPLCNTAFTVSGDLFLRAWGMEQEVSTSEYVTTAVEAKAFAEQIYREYENEIDRQPSYLGGSAPVEIEFSAYYTDAVNHLEWQFSKDANFTSITHRYNDELLRYTFCEEGTTYVRLVASSYNETCIYECDPFEVIVGSSNLEIPNAFSPGTIDGKNDEWRVAYKSIVEYRCWIFNKQGVEMFYSEDPGEGWDGKHGGRLAAPGVYYYVIEARGADKMEYKRSGHINLMRSKRNGNNNNNNSIR